MNWSRVAQYALTGALIGALIGAGLAAYTDDAWLSEDVRSLLTQARARRGSEMLNGYHVVEDDPASPAGPTSGGGVETA